MIATAGVISDSTATVIGAMIVAPLMTPILGIVLAIVLADRPNLLRSVGMVLAGAAAVIFLAWLFGHLAAVPIDSTTSSQVAGRIHPRTVDLIAALATGAVGAVALARSDISDTLPGVAIAISLVPPLAVVGLTLEAGATSEALGALLLFGTNVAAILLSGIVVMTIYKVAQRAEQREGARPPAHRRGRAHRCRGAGAGHPALDHLAHHRPAVVPVDHDQRRGDHLGRGGRLAGGRRVDAPTTATRCWCAASGPSPTPPSCRPRLDEEGLSDVKVIVELVPERRVELGPGGG